MPFLLLSADRQNIGTFTIETKTGAVSPGSWPSSLARCASRLANRGCVSPARSGSAPAAAPQTAGPFLRIARIGCRRLRGDTSFSGSVDARYIQVALPVQRMPDGSVTSPEPSRSKSSCSVFRLMIFTPRLVDRPLLRVTVRQAGHEDAELVRPRRLVLRVRTGSSTSVQMATPVIARGKASFFETGMSSAAIVTEFLMLNRPVGSSRLRIVSSTDGRISSGCRVCRSRVTSSMSG